MRVKGARQMDGATQPGPGAAERCPCRPLVPPPTARCAHGAAPGDWRQAVLS